MVNISPQLLLQASAVLLVSLFVCLLLLPLERYIPQVTPREKPKGRLIVIFALAFTGILSYLIYIVFVQFSIIHYLLPLQIIDLSKMPVPDWALLLISFLILDFLGWLFHWLSHKISPLWRLHAIHHSDENVSAISTLLHHPLELLATGVFVLSFSVILGLPIVVLIGFALVASVHAAFTHADIRISQRIERPLRWLIVTPDVHRTHHSIDMREGNSNFGMILTIWDRLFGTFIDHPARGESAIKMGLPKNERAASFTGMNLLLLPFTRGKQNR